MSQIPKIWNWKWFLLSNSNPLLHRWESESKSPSVVFDSLRPHGLYNPQNSPGQNLEWVAFPFTRGSSQPRDRTKVLHCRQILHQLSHQGSPIWMRKVRLKNTYLNDRYATVTTSPPLISSVPIGSVVNAVSWYLWASFLVCPHIIYFLVSVFCFLVMRLGSNN